MRKTSNPPLATTKKQTPVDSDTEKLNDLIIDSIRDVKGEQIIRLDLRAIPDAPASWFIICHGTSNTQVRGICSKISDRVHNELDTKPLHVEGRDQGKWVLLDYGTTLVHVFYRETREFYDLEGCWSDAQVTEFADL